jgi:hypothetical protein
MDPLLDPLVRKGEPPLTPNQWQRLEAYANDPRCHGKVDEYNEGTVTLVFTKIYFFFSQLA